MHRPPVDPRDRPRTARLDWGSVLAGYALIAAFPLLLWGIDNPRVAVVALATVVGLTVGLRRGIELLRCFRDCGGFSVALGDRVRIAVTQPCLDDSP